MWESSLCCEYVDTNHLCDGCREVWELRIQAFAINMSVLIRFVCGCSPMSVETLFTVTSNPILCIAIFYRSFHTVYICLFQTKVTTDVLVISKYELICVSVGDHVCVGVCACECACVCMRESNVRFLNQRGFVNISTRWGWDVSYHDSSMCYV